jgi:peptide/nickel transport system substrate-binding protein/oligopeptide transport system substrate-binding protein
MRSSPATTGRQCGALRSALLVGLAVAMLLVAGPPAGAAGRTPADPTTYRRPLGNEPATLDPARINDVYSRSVAQQIFDGLVRFDQTLTIAPALAEFWRASRDGLSWTFTLRRGVRFHHGREITADDVVFSFTRILDPRLRSSAAESFLPIKGARAFQEGRAKTVAGLVAVDPRTVQITVDEAFTPFVYVLALAPAKIVPRDLVEAQGEAFGLRPVGTGPFRFAQWDRGRSLVLAANPDYFDGAPRLGRLVYRIFPGENAVAMFDEFQKGQLEDSLVPTPHYSQVVTAAAAGDYLYVKRPMYNLRHYGLNVRIKPLNDRRVRLAIVTAIDRNTILSEIYQGRFIPARGILPPGTLGFNPALNVPTRDLQRARDLLVQAGYPGGRGLPPLTFWSSVKSERTVREHEQMGRDLTAVGIRADFQYQTDWPTFLKMVSERRAPAFLHAWYADVPDPDNFLHLLFHSQSPRNYMGYANPEVDKLLTEARSEREISRRVELYRRAEQLIMDDAVVLPIWHYSYERIFQPYVRSVEVNGLGDPYIPMRKIWLDPGK